MPNELLEQKLSKYVWYAIGNNWPFGKEDQFCAKKTLILAYFGGHESELPGRQTVDNRSTSGVPLKTLEYNAPN